MAVSLSVAQAVVLLNDSFSYADGSLTTNSSFTWITHSGPAGSTGQTQGVSGKAQLLFSQGEDVSAYLAGQPYLSSGTTNIFYAAFTVRFTALPPSAGEYFAHFKDVGAISGFRGRLWALTSGAASQKFRLGISSTTATLNAVSTNDLSLNTDYRVVLRLANTNSVATFWINPSAETDPGVSSTEAASTATVAMFALRQPSSGSAALTLDDLLVGTSFSDVVSATNTPPVIITQPQDQSATAGDNVSFTVVASGTVPLSYQWKSNSVSVANATNDTFTIFNVTTNLNGSTYSVTVTNVAGSTNSQTATLTVNLPSSPSGSTSTISLLTYNVKGNSATDWSTNSAQVQAIGRQLQYLNPDIITFQEIPNDLSYEMTNFVNVFLPGYSLARNSGTDGYIRSMIASRFPITRSTSWLGWVDLRAFGYSNANNNLDNFTRDLFEAQMTAPGFPRPLHVFTAHLKATGTNYADSAAKRAAEAAAITNFFATNLFVLYPFDPYALTGDMNDSDTNAVALQRLFSPLTGLNLTNPKNPVTGSINTYSTTTANPSGRLDYIFPNGLLFSNIKTSQVFRTDRLSPVPPNLNSNDNKVASDHLPVMMVFNNPYDKPFRLTSITRSDPNVTLQWESVFGQPYRVDASSNLTTWTALASNLTATGDGFTLVTNVTGEVRFFRVYRVP